MAVIEVDHLVKAFGQTKAVDDISFAVEAGEVLVIVGASGCGKTTTLRCIAGLEIPTHGTIRLKGIEVASPGTLVPPEHRGVGMVFQSYALWPHKTVFENVAYGLMIKRIAKSAVRSSVARAMELVGLQGLEDRYPATLSGGQQQRVALARSAVSEPRILLLDEPLSNLDAKLREQMRDDLRHLIKTLNMTAVHITHDQTEAMAIADRIICMRAGKIEQVGTARQLYREPVNRFVADFIGMATFFDGTIVERSNAGQVLVEVADNVHLWSSNVTAPPEIRDITLSLRPENIVLSELAPAGRNVLHGKIIDETFLGDHIQYVVEAGGLRFKSRCLREYPVGAPIFASIDPADVICVPREA
jgi:ABC-type Fe3+/spermidine/putrescine transport system ATPase subunit